MQYLALPQPNKPYIPSGVIDMYLQECSYCGNIDFLGTGSCTKCGAQYSGNEQKICIKCRNKILGNSIFCGMCGTSIVPQQAPQIQPVYIQQPVQQVQPVIQTQYVPQQPVVNNYYKPPKTKTVQVVERKRRSCLFDLFMILITGGLWIIWMIIRR